MPNKPRVEELKTLDILADTKEILRKKMETKYGHYTSPEYQNDLIQVFRNKDLKNVSTQIKAAKYFSILADETKDQSRKKAIEDNNQFL